MRLHKLFEGYKILPSIDRNRYQERDGLEGPFRAANGAVYYYDPREGKAYDPDSDMYISHGDFEQMDKERDFNEAWPEDASADTLGKLSGRTDDDPYHVEVSVRDARQANEIMHDQLRGYYENDGSNLFVFDNWENASDAVYALQQAGIEITSTDAEDLDIEDDDAPTWDRSSGEDDFDESVNESTAGPDYTDPEGKFVVVSDGYRFYSIGINQYAEQLPLTNRGFKSVEDAIEDAEDLLGDSELAEGAEDFVRDMTRVHGWSMARAEAEAKKRFPDEYGIDPNAGRNIEIRIDGRPWKVVSNIGHARAIIKTLTAKGKDAKGFYTDKPASPDKRK